MRLGIQAIRLLNGQNVSSGIEIFSNFFLTSENQKYNLKAIRPIGNNYYFYGAYVKHLNLF
jgi:hypothetical protein